MLKTLGLLWPAICPSWRFFSGVGPSPRFEYAWIEDDWQAPICWHEFRPRPAKITIQEMLGRLFWNPLWNEQLFLVSCAERVVEHGSPCHVEEVAKRIQTDLISSGMEARDRHAFQFRLRFVHRQFRELEQVTVYTSAPYPWPVES